MSFRSMIPFGFGGSQLARREGEEYDPFAMFRREFDRLAEDMFGRRALAPWTSQGVDLRLDVSETDKEVKVKAELPGVDEKDVELTLADDVLTIRGEKKAEEERKDQNYHMVERSYGSFVRSLRLPFKVDQDKVNAAFEKGVLTITLPKPPEVVQHAKRIQIKSGGK